MLKWHLLVEATCIIRYLMQFIACIQDEQNNLRPMTFQMFLTSGRDIIDALIKRLIDLYICDSAATDAISSRLRDVCPSLYSCGDELYSKVPCFLLSVFNFLDHFVAVCSFS